eukprot:scaffold221578_cov23-Tisochrysis_lutea.AAC.1
MPSRRRRSTTASSATRRVPARLPAGCASSWLPPRRRWLGVLSASCVEERRTFKDGLLLCACALFLKHIDKLEPVTRQKAQVGEQALQLLSPAQPEQPGHPAIPHLLELSHILREASSAEDGAKGRVGPRRACACGATPTRAPNATRASGASSGAIAHCHRPAPSRPPCSLSLSLLTLSPPSRPSVSLLLSFPPLFLMYAVSFTS